MRKRLQNVESLSKKGGLQFFELKILYVKEIMYLYLLIDDKQRILFREHTKSLPVLCSLCFFSFFFFLVHRFKYAHLSNSLQAILVMSCFYFEF